VSPPAATGGRFDERYKDTSTELEQRAQALEQNLANELPADGNDLN
jgi:hypothetical protein